MGETSENYIIAYLVAFAVLLLCVYLGIGIPSMDPSLIRDLLLSITVPFFWGSVLYIGLLAVLGKWKIKKLRKFTLLMLASAIVISLIAFLLQDHKYYHGNEESAIRSLRTVSHAQDFYYDKFKSYGTLNQLHNKDMIPRILAKSTTSSSAKSGYYFVMRLGTGAWCCGARAAEWGVTGERSFRISEDGVIYYSEKDEDLTKTTSGTALGG